MQEEHILNIFIDFQKDFLTQDAFIFSNKIIINKKKVNNKFKINTMTEKIN